MLNDQSSSTSEVREWRDGSGGAARVPADDGGHGRTREASGNRAARAHTRQHLS